MVKRISAFKTIFNFLLTVVQLLIGLRFLLDMAGSSDTISGTTENVRSVLEQMSYGSSSIMGSMNLEGPVSLLILTLGFMIFSFILITVVPGAARRMERQIEDEYD